MEYFQKDSKINAILFTRDNFDKICKLTKGRAYDLTIEKQIGGSCYFNLAVPGHGIQRIYENNYLIFSNSGSFEKAVGKELFETEYAPITKGKSLDSILNDKENFYPKALEDLLTDLKFEKSLYSYGDYADDDTDWYQRMGKVEGLDYAISKVEQITNSIQNTSFSIPKCNIEDTLYYLDEFHNKVLLLEVTGILISKGVNGPVYQYNCCSYDTYNDVWDEYEFEASDFNEVVFLKESDAEKMLEKRNEQKMNHSPGFTR